MFDWNNDFSVGVGSIDAQHQNLFAIGRELHTAMLAGQAKSVQSKLLERLVQYTTSHFSHEERLMRQAHFPGVDAHVAQHQELTAKVLQFQADVDSGKHLISLQLLQFLRSWLEHHILKSDKAYSPYLSNRSAA